MALALANGVQETTSTTGTGTISLAGAVSNFQTFVAGVGSGNTTYYRIAGGGQWEVGIGTVTSGSPDTLSRDTVLESSNANSLVSFNAGAKSVACVVPASRGWPFIMLDDGADSAPAIRFINDQDTGFYLPSTGQIGLAVGGSIVSNFQSSSITLYSKVIIDGSNYLGIGTASPVSPIHLLRTGEAVQLIGSSNAGGATFLLDGAADGDGSGGDYAYLKHTGGGDLEVYNQKNAKIIFGTNGNTGQVFLQSSGIISVGKDSTSTAVQGANIAPAGTSHFVTDGATPLLLNRLTNDGTLLSLNQAGVEEGAISVSGTTVTYQTFTGGHIANWSGGNDPQSIKRGTVLATVDEEYRRDIVEWTEDAVDENGEPITVHCKSRACDPSAPAEAKPFDAPKPQLVNVEVSKREGDARVYGVYETTNQHGEVVVHALGTTVVRVTGPCAGGDLLESAGDGTARRQADNIVRSSTIGKASRGDGLTTERLLPAVIYAG